MPTKKKTTKKPAETAKKKIKISEVGARKLTLTEDEIGNMVGGAPSSVGTQCHCDPSAE